MNPHTLRPNGATLKAYGSRPVLRLLFLMLLGTCSLVTTLPASASDKTPEQIAQEVYGAVMSPFCPARLLTDCPSPSATELKEKILNELKAGKTKEQVLQELYSTFGSTVRAAPEASGFGALAWWIPIGFVLGGLGIYAVWLARKRNEPGRTAPEPLEAISPEMQKRIESELNRLDS